MTPRTDDALLEQLSAYLDDALSIDERAALKARLRTDDSMRQTLAELRAVRNILRATPQIVPPRDFRLTVAQVRRTRSVRPARVLWAVGTLAALLILAVGFYSIVQTSQPASTNGIVAQATQPPALAFQPTSAVLPSARPAILPPTATNIPQTFVAQAAPIQPSPTALQAARNIPASPTPELAAAQLQSGAAAPPTATPQPTSGAASDFAAPGLSATTAQKAAPTQLAPQAPRSAPSPAAANESVAPTLDADKAAQTLFALLLILLNAILRALLSRR